MNVKINRCIKNHISTKERLQIAMQIIIRQDGVSGLLAALKVDIEKRHIDDQDRVWGLLLPIAEEVIHGLYARQGESLLVWSNIPPWVAIETTYDPMINAQVTTIPYGYIEWYADPHRNVSDGWDREVH